ncbi:phosphonopyruvate decarboxylase [Helicobacter sp. 11S02596-1]|uniref:phosphonopyruvate decarboxylase n=1 Tax=Helicobacter sp. 11S02596-1 TaxID=1476194 RepID=UPI000BA4EE1B|nr:phosphonopyruvate decarboxylase [Helicobacter sp. 11S02596-1]PAF45191.1 phosphonopyruvate decarboxylase [Helicobacter sp. 11S02596-1]
MLDTQEFGKILKQYDFKTFAGVPCSFLAPLINHALNEKSFIMANNEGDAIAIASGISLSQNEIGVVLMQNSGLSNALSPLTSLNYTFELPILGFVSLRGEAGIADEPQHELLGTITDKILEVCKIDYDFLSPDISEASKQILSARNAIANNKSFIFIVRKNTFKPVELQTQSPIPANPHLCVLKTPKTQNPEKEKPKRIEALHIIHQYKEAIILATTGKTGRELYEITDSPNQLYMVGSMGCISPLALGLSLKITQKVIAIDGDGALLMRMGNLTTNAFYAKGNFCHICLDNQSHDSTGGQFSLSPYSDIPQIALSCGYKNVFTPENLEDFKNTLDHFIYSQNPEGATFIYLPIQKGSKENLSRPKIKPKEVKQRLQHFIKNSKDKNGI